MTCTNEPNNHNGESKKSELLPTGDKAKEIIVVLAEMYRAKHNPEDPTNADDKGEHANWKRDTRPDKEGQEQTG